MVVTRNSQRSPQTSEVTSINKLIAKQKSEKRKIKKAKAEDKKRHNATQGMKMRIGMIYIMVFYLLFVNDSYYFYNYYNRTSCSFCQQNHCHNRSA
jgi:hypothetical protein